MKQEYLNKQALFIPDEQPGLRNTAPEQVETTQDGGSMRAGKIIELLLGSL